MGMSPYLAIDTVLGEAMQHWGAFDIIMSFCADTPVTARHDRTNKATFLILSFDMELLIIHFVVYVDIEDILPTRKGRDVK